MGTSSDEDGIGTGTHDTGARPGAATRPRRWLRGIGKAISWTLDRIGSLWC